jgi:hypothetical protein
MLRTAVPSVGLVLCLAAALGSAGARASRPNVPSLVEVQAGAFAAVVKWHVDEPARVVVEVGTDERYGIWSPTTTARDL